VIRLRLNAPDPRSLRLFALLGLCLIVHVTLAWTTRPETPSWLPDDTEYIQLAREIAHGDYRERWFVSEPEHARLPPGFPALLAVSNLLFGDHLTVQKLVVLALSAASLALFFFAVRHRLGDLAAVFVTVFTALNVFAMTDATMVMSEAPFRFWVALLFWADSDERAGNGHRWVAGAAAVIAALTRTAGVAVIAALLLHWALQKRWKAVALLALGSVPVALWIVWTVVAPEQQTGLYVQTVLRAPDAGTALPLALAERAFRNAATYLRSGTSELLGFWTMPASLIDNVLWAIVALITIPAGFVYAWRRWTLLCFLLFFYGGVLFLWPFVDPRFISPVSSLLLALIAAGTLFWFKRAPKVGMALVTLVTLTLTVGSLQAVGNRISTARACDRSRPVAVPGCYREDWRGMMQLATYVRDSTPTAAVFFVPKGAAFYYHAGRRTVPEQPFRGVTSDSIASILRRNGIQYAISTPIGVGRAQRNAMIANACREFDLVNAFSGDAVLLRVRQEGPLASDGEACRVTDKWKHGDPPGYARLYP
jgi:hypothetical protein